MSPELVVDKREHRGFESPRPRDFGHTRERCVFINCPYDADYTPIFDGIIFAIVCCGLIPLAAKGMERGSQTRIARIVAAIKASKYSLHDLSRCQGEGPYNLARFNMPLELGIAMGEHFDQAKPRDWHDWLVLVPPGNTYANFISDLAGYDPKSVASRVDSVIPAVLSWLSAQEDAMHRPAPDAVLAAVPRFHQRLELLRRDWGGHEPWARIVESAVETGQSEKLIPSARRRR